MVSQSVWQIFLQGDNGAYTGKTAEEDIPRLTGSEEFEEIIGTQYISAVPEKVIKTGV